MKRLDPVYGELCAQEQTDAVKAKITEREKLLLPIYHQISVQFADLHDRAGRMASKNTIRKALEWRNARRYFFWRARRRLDEEYLVKSIGKALPRSTRLERMSRLKSWVNGGVDWEDDRAVAEWLEAHSSKIGTAISKLAKETCVQNIISAVRSDSDNAVSNLAEAIKALSPADKDALLRSVSS
jgi:acetyl-CoA carboxylase/biotin carboxylase 1